MQTQHQNSWIMNRRNFIKSSAFGAGVFAAGSMPVLSMTAKVTGNPHTLIPESSLFASPPPVSHCLLPAHEAPVIAEVDVVVVGGTSGAVATATEVVRGGVSVFLIAPMPYLGEDICGTLQLWKENDQPATPLAHRIFAGQAPPFPLHVKTVLEDELLLNNVPFLYSSYGVDLLYDTAGQAAGVLIVNRSGCQAIRAKIVVDATIDATVARSGHFLPDNTTGKQQYEFITIGNGAKTDPRIVESQEMPEKMQFGKMSYTARRFVFEFPDAGNDYAALAAIEQQIRDITWDPDQVDSADVLIAVPTSSIKKAAPGLIRVDAIPLDALRPPTISNFYVLNGYAGVSRETARQLLRPISLMALGARLGSAVAIQAKGLAMMQTVNIRSPKGKTIKAVARELTEKLRPAFDKGMIKLNDIQLPVWGDYDTIVLGGGTAGAPAAISGGREGIKVLTLDYLHGMGGLGTLGLIGRYWDGFREGFTKEIDAGVCAMAPTDHPRQKKKCDEEWCSDWKIEWYRREIRKGKGDIWFGSLGCGAVVDGNRVCGIVVATPFGRGVVLAKTVVDSTGSADIAIAAGAAYDYTGKQTVAIQGAGLGHRNPDDFYNNNDWTFIDDSDVLDISRAFVAAKAKFKGRYDIVKIPQTRERRRVIAEHNVSTLDVINGRTYLDTLSYHTSSFDTHGFTVDPYFTLKPPEKRHKIYNADVPLRTLIPKGLTGILVTGLGTGAHRDAMPVIRMQPCLQNQGYAVGYLLAMAIKEKKDVAQVDMKKIQRHLVDMGNLPSRVLTDKDNFPLTDAQLATAANALSTEMNGLEIVLTDVTRAIPVLKQCFQQKSDKINYVHTLAMLGDATGLQVLIDEVNRFTAWDDGWAYTGMGQFGPCMSRLDSLIMALGATRQTEALPAVFKHAKRLTLAHDFSHIRAVCIAFETIGSKEAAPVLYDLLQIPGMRQTAISTYQQARNTAALDANDVLERNRALKELHLARALYRCGDKEGLGASILRAYTDDYNNHYARHAKGILSATQSNVIYDFAVDKDLSRWLLEGNGELSVSDDGSFKINTFFRSGNQKATNVWLKDLILPDDFEIEIAFMSRSENGNTMIIFNALPFELNDLFADPRIDAVYADLASKRKMQAYTVGFHRATYHRPSVLRKIGGKVPDYWGDAPYPTSAWQEMDSITVLSSTTEPLSPADKGQVHCFKLQKIDNHIKFWVNGALVHDCKDMLQYPYGEHVLKNGRIGFRNFGGPAEDFYSKIVIKEIVM